MAGLVVGIGAFGGAPPLRGFQEEVLALARERNVVMVGATGIGKTFVAIALLSEQDYSGGRRAFFLAPTRQLVWQITAKVQQQSTLRVRSFCGQSMDAWGQHEWERELALTRVVVCTPEVLRNALERGFVALSRVNLLVFDECHHVTKRHPYAQVIKLYDPQKREQMPRVFGTTACPTKDCAAKLHAELKKIELQDHEVARYAAAAPIQVQEYDEEEDDEAEGDEASFLAQIMATVNLDQPAGGRREEKEEEALQAAWLATSHTTSSKERALLAVLLECKAVSLLQSLVKQGRSEAARDDARCAKLVAKFVAACVDIHRKWGLWCVYKFVELELHRAAINASLLVSVPGSMYGYDAEARRALVKLEMHLDACAFAASARLRKLVELLEQRLVDAAPSASTLTLPDLDSGDEEDEEDEEEDEEEEEELPSSPRRGFDPSLQGILFVTTRAECRVVCEFLNAKFSASAPLFACVLGQSSSARDTASFRLPRMEETLLQFERGALRFLVSTAVSIEGVDFPECSLVIVGDRIPTARKLMQLRGRARRQDGVVYYLMAQDDRDHAVHFQVMAKEAAAIHALDFTHDKQETLYQQPRSQAVAQLGGGSKILPAEASFVVESTQAVLDLDSSISRINLFCQSLPAQLYSVDFKNLYAFTREDVMKRPMFKATLTLPSELGLPVVETELLHSKATAKATAAFEACKLLLQRGHLDASLNSTFRKDRNAVARAQDAATFIRNRLLP